MASSETNINRTSSKVQDWGLRVEDKWKIVSHLHKAIRHGRADDAEQGVRWLLELDPTYLRYRMAVIAQEDVAAGSPEVVAESMKNGWDKNAWYSMGPEYIIEQARNWANAIKDRTPCTYLDCGFFLPEFEKQKGSWVMLPPKTAARLALDEEKPWWFRGLAAWRAVGSNVFKGSVPTIQGDLDFFIDKVAEAGLLSEAQMDCLLAGYKYQAEAHPVFYPLVIQQQQKSPINVIEKKIPQLGYCGPYLSSALDKHTSEGKKALQELWKSNPEGQKVLISTCSSEVAQKMIGSLWFWMEGGLLDRSLDYTFSNFLDMESKKIRLKNAQIHPQSLFQSFGKDIGLWQLERAKQIKNIYRPTTSSVLKIKL